MNMNSKIKPKSKKFTKANYERLDRLVKSERKKNAAQKVTPEFIDSLTK